MPSLRGIEPTKIAQLTSFIASFTSDVVVTFSTKGKRNLQIPLQRLAVKATPGKFQ